MEENGYNSNYDNEYAAKVLSRVLDVSIEDGKRVIEECEKCGCEISAFSFAPENLILCTISVNRLKSKIGDNTYAEYSARSDNIVEKMLYGHRYLLVFDAPILLLISSLLKESSIGTVAGKIDESISTSSIGITGEALMKLSQALTLSFSMALISYLIKQNKRLANEEMYVIIVVLSNEHLRENKFSCDELFSKSFPICRTIDFRQKG